MLRSVSPADLGKKKYFFCSTLTGTWPDHSALQAPKIDYCGVNAVAKGAAGWHNVLQ